MTSWVDIAYTAVALVVAGLLVYVMQKTEHDRINRVDAIWVQWFRRATFTACALMSLYSILSTDWQFTCLMLMGLSAVLLAVNAIALSLRTPPSSGGKMRSPVFRHSNFVMRLISYFSASR